MQVDCADADADADAADAAAEGERVVVEIVAGMKGAGVLSNGENPRS
jgi:hypothetical protein